MSGTVAAVKIETPAETLARLKAENAAMLEQIAAMKQRESAKAGEFKLGVTVARLAGTNGVKDKGSKGGSLHVSLGQQHIYPSLAMVTAIVDHWDEIQKFMSEHSAELVR